VDAKPSPQHRQHFNLSESAKQMLEELTAQRYPGKQRRQSQLVEDLITEAFMKEHAMNIVTSMQSPDDRFAPSTLESLSMAQQEALRMDANAVYPEHLLLGVIAQGENRAAKLLCLSGMDMPALRVRAMDVFGTRSTAAITEELTFTKEAQECLERAIKLAETAQEAQVLPEHLVLAVLHHETMQTFLTPFLPSLNRLVANLTNRIGLVPVLPGDTPEKRLLRHQRLKELYAQRLKKFCPSCKREVQSVWKHCVFCGETLEKNCPKCGTPVPGMEGVRFCFECGSPLA
jgi:hypothetical protein